MFSSETTNVLYDFLSSYVADEIIYPNVVASKLCINMQETYEILLQAVQDGIISPLYMEKCPICCCDIEKYSAITDIPFGKAINCPHCNKSHILQNDHIMVYFTSKKRAK